MNKKHGKTLEAIFSTPVRYNIPFRDVEALLKAVGCSVDNLGGSVVRFSRGKQFWLTHRPHPQKEAKGHQVSHVRRYLSDLGIKP